jgi:hypothetical protein
MSLHGYRRFKTIHLLNLQLLENEIVALDNFICSNGYMNIAGVSLLKDIPINNPI